LPSDIEELLALFESENEPAEEPTVLAGDDAATENKEGTETRKFSTIDKVSIKPLKVSAETLGDEPSAEPKKKPASAIGAWFGRTFSFLKRTRTPEQQAAKEKRRAARADRKAARKARKERERAEYDEKYDEYGNPKKPPSSFPIRPKREKRTGCFNGILLALFILCVSAVLSVLMWLGAADLLGLGKAEREVTVIIPRGFTIEDVADILYDAELIEYKQLFMLFADFSDAEEKIKAGTYILNGEYDYRALVTGMSPSGAKRIDVTITFPEGTTLSEAFAKLEHNGVAYADELQAAADNLDFEYSALMYAPELGTDHRLEGYLFPDTYKFYVNDDPERVIKKFLDNFALKWKDEYYEKAEALGLSPYEIIIVASMIEKEAGSESDRALIASVIYNRLASANYPHLEIDSTSYYAAARLGVSTANLDIRGIDSPYNTYITNGLPPGPICNPGLASIIAALNPANTGYYYYALHIDGSHRFFRTAQEQYYFIMSDEYGG